MSIPEGLTGPPIAHRGLWRGGVRPENSLAAFEADGLVASSASSEELEATVAVGRRA